MPAFRFASCLALPALMTATSLSPARADEWVKQLDAVPSLLRTAPAGSLVVNRCWTTGALDRAATRRVAIRAAPRADARLLRTIPSFRREGGEWIAPEFLVIGARAGWLLIHDIGFAGYVLPGQTLFAGTGWIDARHMKVQIEGLKMFRDADPASPLVVDLTPSSPAREARLLAVHGCSGSMLEASMRLADGRAARGWVFGACANQVTTCGGGARIAVERNGRLVPAQGD